MTLSRRVCLKLLMVALFLVAANLSTNTSEPQAMGGREPFVLELPELSQMSITAPVVQIPTSALTRFQLRVRAPYSYAINYGKIYTKINGESANTIMNIRAGADGYRVDMDLLSKPHLRLHSGKNVVEIMAIDRNHHTYYASYVLIAESRPAESSVATTATIEKFPVGKAEESQAPVVWLLEPKEAIRLGPRSAVLSVRGIAGDALSKITSVKINGKIANLSPVKAERGLIQTGPGSPAFAMILTSFHGSIQIGPAVHALVIEAIDANGSRTRVTLPFGQADSSVSTQFTGRKFAVVIGISRYKYHDGGLTDLKYADADARSVRDFLQEREGGNFSASDIFYLENEQATLDAVRTGLRNFLPRAGPADLVFFFIAGHGAPDPYAPQNLYFLLSDSKVADMPNTALPMDEVKQVLNQNLRAQRVIAFIDTCHSAGLSGGKLVLTRGLENNLVNLYAAQLFKERGTAVLTSSDINEISHESEQWGGGHGIFTMALLEGLRGDADLNRDHLVTAGELFRYVHDRVSVATAFEQNPKALPGLNRDLTLSVAMVK